MIPYYTQHCPEAVVGKSRASAFAKVLAALRAQFRPLIRGMFSRIPGGDKIFEQREKEMDEWVRDKKNGNFLVEAFLPKGSADAMMFLELGDINSLYTDFGKRHHNRGVGYLVAYGFSKSEGARKHIDAFHEALRKAIQKAFGLKRVPVLASIGAINKKFETLRTKKNRTSQVCAEVADAVDLLKESEFRNTIIRAKQAKDPTVENIVKSTGLNANVVEPLLAQGVDRKILGRQYNVVCSRCGNVLARVSAKSAISQMEKDGVSCPVCRTKVKDSSYVDSYIVQDRIGALLDKSEWMHIYVRLRLDPLLCGAKSVTSVIDGPNELDLIANVDGAFLLAELKDSRFSIGHAYSFVGKCSQYQPDLALIVATQGIDKDVKDYISNTGIAPQYVEELAKLDSTLFYIFSQQNAQRLAKLLGEMSWDSLIVKSLLANFDAPLPIPEEAFHRAYRLGRLPKWASE